MVEINGLKFDFKLTPLTRLKFKQLIAKEGLTIDDIDGTAYLMFMTAVCCNKPHDYIDSPLDEYAEIQEGLSKSEEYDDYIDSIINLGKNDKREKKQESKTHK